MANSFKELAKELGVSPSAVSLALNGRKGVSEETRQTILKAAERRGLLQNRRRKPSSERLSLVIYRDHGQVFGDTPFFANVMESIGSEAADLGYSFQVLYVQKQRDIREQLCSAGLENSAGVIVLATELLSEDVAPFKELAVPSLLFDSNFSDPALSCVGIDNVQGAYLSTRCLLQHGHRQLCHLHSSVDIHNFRERRVGFLMAAETHTMQTGEQVHTETVRVGSTHETALRDMDRYLDSLDGAPLTATAFFADNDIIAVACMQALQAHGYRIPEDVSIAGFDDFPIAANAIPPLTTVHVDQQQLGRAAVRMLHREIRNQTPHPHWVYRIKTTLVERSSVRSLV